MKAILKNERANKWKCEWKRMKYWVRLKKLKNIRFSRTTIGCSGYFYKIFGIAINYILCEKKWKEKAQWKCAKTAISGIFMAFSAGKIFFSKIGLDHVLSIPNTHLCAKIQEKLILKSRENAKKPVFPAYFRHFRPEKYVLRKSGSVTF